LRNIDLKLKKVEKTPIGGEMETSSERRWLEHLSEEDLAFLKRFLLASGTLKELARQYGISYPTVRLRLDRLIDKVKLIDEQSGADPFELRLRSLYAEARLDEATFRELLRAYREEERSEQRESTR
jgi:hypothetical protein